MLIGDMIEVLRSEMKKGSFKAVMHSFASSEGLCECAIDVGCYISFSGIVTFKNTHNLKKIAKNVPIDRILIETDSPYLTPEPIRGRKKRTI